MVARWRSQREKTWAERYWRATLELFLLAGCIWVGLAALTALFAPSVPRSLLLFIVGPLCMIFYGLRFPLLKQGGLRWMLIEVGSGVLWSLVFGGIAWSLNLLPGGGLAPAVHWKFTTEQAAGIASLCNLCAFAVMRGGMRLWLYWGQLRRRRLLWAFTHAHLAGVVFLIAIFAIVSILWASIATSDLSLVILLLLGMVLLGGCVLPLMLPLSLMMAYVIVRRTKPRLKALAAATGAFREGNYAMRIQVEGEDEVAQLQSDFNAMAETLEETMSALQRTVGELKQERDTVTKLLQERRQLVANVSHELRTPLATLRSYLEITLGHWQEQPMPALQRNLQVMEEEILHLQTQVDDLFALSREEVGRLALRQEAIDISSLATRIVEARAPLARRTNHIEMIAEIAPELPLVLGDATRLEQALHNLMHNALRHTPPGGIIAVVAYREKEWVVLQVKDTGEGIATEDIPHIWERFYQARHAGSHTRGGAGLGLALCKEWIEAMGGEISVESNPGEGSCFSMRLRAATTVVD